MEREEIGNTAKGVGHLRTEASNDFKGFGGIKFKFILFKCSSLGFNLKISF